MGVNPAPSALLKNSIFCKKAVFSNPFYALNECIPNSSRNKVGGYMRRCINSSGGNALRLHAVAARPTLGRTMNNWLIALVVIAAVIGH